MFSLVLPHPVRPARCCSGQERWGSSTTSWTPREGRWVAAGPPPRRASAHTFHSALPSPQPGSAGPAQGSAVPGRPGLRLGSVSVAERRLLIRRPHCGLRGCGARGALTRSNRMYS